ncbi:hypothetical protein VNI00_003344 [Paramarasmius palmivorus]|uniref:Eukaryotic translation initiation factor 3 subunit F n=1 Tax=Paramarasmius palmivorus TaxID=297713 RepID=A0AAW0DQH3_9AGAR
MPLSPPSSAVHVQTKIPLGAQSGPRTPTSIHVHPVALFSILDHYLRRSPNQPRVIGTLLGQRNADTGLVEVHSSYAVLHSETQDQVAVDMEYHRGMFELCQKVNPKDVIVGWYSTGTEGEEAKLNTYDALIMNFYSQECAPHQAVHVKLSTGLEEGSTAGVQGFVSSPVGVLPKPENCVFQPIPVSLQFRETERSGLDLLTTVSTNQTSSPISPFPVTSLDHLESSLQQVQSMLDRVLSYVRSVLNGSVKGDPAVGRYLMDTLGVDLDLDGKGGFNSRLQDTLMMSYLSSLVRSQAEVSSRLALVT